MKLWAIIKMIAGIISNLPFDADEQQARDVLVQAYESVEKEPSIQQASIPRSDWEELIDLLVPVLMWVISRLRNRS